MKTKTDAIATIISAMPSYGNDYPDVKKDSKAEWKSNPSPPP